jgi:phosphate transport system protein
VILGDHPINRTARAIDRKCHAFVARHVPSAGHLRFVSAVMRVNIALERIGDYAGTIGREVAQMVEPPPAAMARDIEDLSEHGRRILEQALASFEMGSVDLARGTMAFAAQRSRTFHKIFTDLLEEGESRSRPVEDLFGLLVVLYRLERVADQAKNICEETVFVVTGEAKQPKVYSILFVDGRNDRWSQMAEAIARKAYPESGTYASAGWDPADAIDPGTRAYLDENGFEVREARPSVLPTDHDDLLDYHVMVGLEPGLRERVADHPFHTVVLEWEGLGPDTSPEEARQRLSAHVQELMETLRGEDAP